MSDYVINSFANYSDAAIITITRGSDSNTELTNSKLVLSESEKAILKAVKRSGQFRKKIVLLNVTNTMSMDWADDPEYGIDAILYIGAPGYYGAGGIVDILLGSTKDGTPVSPSGRAPDTFAYSVASSPSNMNSAGVDYVVYQEGNYIGYKYYETRYEDYVYGRGNANSSAGVTNVSAGNNWAYENEVVYPFGHGLTYADINQSLISVEDAKAFNAYLVNVRVKNSSSYETNVPVLVYAKQPYTDFDVEKGIDKSAIILAGYENVCVAANETVDTTIYIPKYLLASYDSVSNKAYILEEGDYWFGIGDNAHDALNSILYKKDGLTNLINFDGASYQPSGVKAAKVTIPFTHYDKAPYPKSGATFNEFKHADYNYNAKLQNISTITFSSRSDWSATWPYTKVSGVPVTNEQVDMRQYAPTEDEEGTTDKVYTKNGNNVTLEDMQLVPAKGVASSGLFAGENAESVWQNFVEQMSTDELASIISDAYGLSSINSVKKPGTRIIEGVQGIASRLSYGDNRWATCFPGAQIVAATFNHNIQKRLGKMIADEALLCNSVIIKGPDLSVARTPGNGDNCNFFSEDPILNYYAGSNMISAAKDRGVILVARGCCLHSSILHDIGLITFCNEQTIREVYLKPFEGALTRGGGLAIETSYNCIGPIYSGANKNLLTSVIRNEWGFDGFICDSAHTGGNNDQYSNGPAMLASGIDLFSLDFYRGKQLNNWNFTLTSSLQRAAKNILYALSKSALYSLGNANFVGVKNDYIYSNNDRPNLDVPVLKEKSNYDFSSADLNSIANIDSRSGHKIVYQFEGIYSECFQFDTNECLGIINLWDDGIFSGSINKNIIKGYWYSSSMDNNTGKSDCLVLLTENGYNQAFDIGGFYTKGLVAETEFSWGHRWMMLCGAKYSPTNGIKIYKDPLARFRVGDGCYDENFPVYRVTENGAYFPIIDKTDLQYSYSSPSGVLYNKQFADEGELTTAVTWKNFTTSCSSVITK